MRSAAAGNSPIRFGGDNTTLLVTKTELNSKAGYSRLSGKHKKDLFTFLGSPLFYLLAVVRILSGPYRRFCNAPNGIIEGPVSSGKSILLVNRLIPPLVCFSTFRTLVYLTDRSENIQKPPSNYRRFWFGRTLRVYRWSLDMDDINLSHIFNREIDKIVIVPVDEWRVQNPEYIATLRAFLCSIPNKDIMVADQIIGCLFEPIFSFKKVFVCVRHISEVFTSSFKERLESELPVINFHPNRVGLFKFHQQ